MISQIILTIEHGETTDFVQDIAESISERYHREIVDCTVRIDVDKV